MGEIGPGYTETMCIKKLPMFLQNRLCLKVAQI